jgi:hypothetical protein
MNTQYNLFEVIWCCVGSIRSEVGFHASPNRDAFGAGTITHSQNFHSSVGLDRTTRDLVVTASKFLLESLFATQCIRGASDY